MNKKHLLLVFVVAGLILSAHNASAHAVVSPKQANVAAFQTFNLGVPSEKDMSTVSVRLVLPDGLNYATPNVKQGWKIDVKKDGTGDSNHLTEIDWSGGNIPTGQRDEFVFSAQVPSKAGMLQWKVYQTYSDGSVVSWDADPKTPAPKDANAKSDFSTKGPFSETQIIDDTQPQAADSVPKTPSQNLPLILSIAAIAIAVVGGARKKS
jgi:uncharacterized protein YcnI